MLRVGLIGAGMVSRHHLIGWAALGDKARVVAIADPSTENRERRAGEFGIASTYPDLDTMLAAETLDAVDIAAPREVHARLVRAAAARNLAILCQKPLAEDLARAEALAAEMAGTRLMVHENWRFRHYYRDAAEWVRAGRIGTVQQCRMTLLTSGLLPGEDGVRPALQRQPFMRDLRRMLVNEVLIHHLDTLRVLLGELRVTACRLGRNCPDMAGEDNALITLQALADSATGPGAVLLGNMAAKDFPATQADDMLLIGDAGSIRLQNSTLSCSSAEPESRKYDLAACYQGSYDATIAHFVAALESGGPFETSPADSLRTLRLVEDCYAFADRK